MAATVAALEVVLQHEHDPAMEELRRELAAAHRELAVAHRANVDLQSHVGWLELQHEGDMMELVENNAELERRLAQARADNISYYWTMGSSVEPRRLLTWREFLEQELAYQKRREADLADGADRLVRWAAQGGSEEDVPDEIWRAIQVMRGKDEGTDDESDDDAEMAVDSAAVP
jgi:hypothetical protein